MPKKIETETQLLRLLSNSPIQVDVELLQTASHQSQNTSGDHLLKFYKTIEDVRNERFDGLIITGAPVEQIPFEEVDYWDELCDIMTWSRSHVYSTLTFAGALKRGCISITGFPNTPLKRRCLVSSPTIPCGLITPLLRGFDETFFVPHSRHTEVRAEDIQKHDELLILTGVPDFRRSYRRIPGRTAVFLSPGIRNMTGTPCSRNTAEILIRGCLLILPTIILRTTIPIKSRFLSGEATQTSSSPTGSTILSIRLPLTT